MRPIIITKSYILIYYCLCRLPTINVFLLCFIKCPCVLQRGMRFYILMPRLSFLLSDAGARCIIVDQLFRQRMQEYASLDLIIAERHLLHSIKVSCAGSNQFLAFYAHLVCEQIEPGQDAINYISLLKNAAFKGSADMLDTLLNMRKKDAM